MHLLCKPLHKENSYIPIAAHNASRYDNHLILPKIAKTECNPLCVDKNIKRYIFFPLRKKLQKKKNLTVKLTRKVFAKIY